MVRACDNLAISAIDENGELIEGKNYCLIHTPDPGKIQADIVNYIQNHETIIGLNASKISFTDMDFSNKKFYGRKRNSTN